MVETQTLQGRYRLDARLASGGMGTVYAATDERLGRKVAVKVLRGEFADDPRFVERFRREARAVAALSHPNIAAIFDYGQDDHHFIVMELVQGLDLARVLREDGALAPARAANIEAQICAALAHAHEAGIVHRDVKPANVIVDEGERVKVTDFGIARAVGESTITATGSMLGTAQYLSPEQAGGGEVGPPSDIYSAGVVLYEMLTGVAPFTGDSAVAVVMRHVTDDVPPPSLVNPDVPPDLDAIVAKATAKEPRARFSDAHEMSAALTRTVPTKPNAPVAGQTAPLTTPEITERAPRSAPGGPRRISGPALIALLALAAVLFFVWLFRPSTGDPSSSERSRQPGAAGERGETPQDAPASYTIEDLSGRHKDEAKQYLEGLGMGLVIGEEKVESDEFEKDLVVGTFPEVGTTVDEGAAITLLVSEGEKPGHEGKGRGHEDKKHGDKEEEDED